MSDINIFNDPNKVPQPKDQIRIEALKATPYPDRFRIHVKVVVTAFQERPNLLLALYNAEGKCINELDVIATMHSEMEFTIHIRNVDEPAGEYKLQAELFYETRQPPQDKRLIDFAIPQSN